MQKKRERKRERKTHISFILYKRKSLHLDVRAMSVLTFGLHHNIIIIMMTETFLLVLSSSTALLLPIRTLFPVSFSESLSLCASVPPIQCFSFRFEQRIHHHLINKNRQQRFDLSGHFCMQQVNRTQFVCDKGINVYM